MSRWLIAYNTRPALPTLNREAQPPQPTANDAERRCLPIGSINNIPGSFHNAIDISGDICRKLCNGSLKDCCKQACMLYLVEHGGQKVERNAHLRSFTGHSKGQKSACDVCTKTQVHNVSMTWTLTRGYSIEPSPLAIYRKSTILRYWQFPGIPNLSKQLLILPVR